MSLHLHGQAAPPVPPGSPPGGSSVGDSRIELKIPARPEFLAIIRQTLTAFAARTGFSPTDIEDFRIAVNEACSAAILAEGRQLHVALAVVEGPSLEARIVHTPVRSRSGPERRDMELLHCLVLHSLASIVQSETQEGQIVTYVAKRPRRPKWSTPADHPAARAASDPDRGGGDEHQDHDLQRRAPDVDLMAPRATGGPRQPPERFEVQHRTG